MSQYGAPVAYEPLRREYRGSPYGLIVPRAPVLPPAIDTVVNTGTIATAGSPTWNHTCNNAGLLLLFVSIVGSSTASAPTYNGVAMARVTIATNTGQSEIWALANPASGTHAVVYHSNGQNSINVCSVSVLNSTTTSHPQAAAPGGVSTVTVNTPSTASGLVLSQCACLFEALNSATGTQVARSTGYIGTDCIIMKQPGTGGSVVSTFTTTAGATNLITTSVAIP